MGWSTGFVNQAPNTTVEWIVGPHSALSRKDIIVLNVINFGAVDSAAQLNRVRILLRPVRYSVVVQTFGSNNIAFQIEGQEIND
jgi:hypothetical protein